MWIKDYNELLSRRRQFVDNADVWRFDTGGIWVGFLNDDEEATWVGTVTDIIEEII